MCRQLLTALVVGVVIMGALEMGGAEAKPDPTQLAQMADVIKYLHELDKYYSPMSRPRFGKRSEMVLPPGDALVSVRDQQMEASERLLETLARRR
ncbi:neuropeptide F-like isoform X4 [Portunus trituberculatus]|uniref:neuropeptide F-like isoform X4 n=1 Tax=Portunus trituberculatus TaxID=210409 RepID=UPI001E1CF955|nr:neuropeptide F-like isoform X4 [Portunus trituberculatus]